MSDLNISYKRYIEEGRHFYALPRVVEEAVDGEAEAMDQAYIGFMEVFHADHFDPEYAMVCAKKFAETLGLVEQRLQQDLGKNC